MHTPNVHAPQVAAYLRGDHGPPSAAAVEALRPALGSVSLDRVLGDLLAELVAARALIGMTDHGQQHRDAAEAVALARDVIADALDRVRAP